MKAKRKLRIGNCPDCGGLSYRQCMICGGAGCHQCEGVGAVPCWTCDGTGHKLEVIDEKREAVSRRDKKSSLRM